MQVTIHTERGTFKSKRHAIQAKDAAALKDLLQQVAADGSHFTLETENGYVVLGTELLRAAAFVVEA